MTKYKISRIRKHVLVQYPDTVHSFFSYEHEYQQEGRKMISRCARHQLPAFVTVCRLLICPQCHGSLPHALWLWPLAVRCCRSEAPLNSAPPAAPTSPTSGSVQHRRLLSMDGFLLPVVSPSAHCHSFLTAV